MLPAPAQGALAVECRADRVDVREALAALDDADSRAAVTAERAVLARLEAGCAAPIGALAEVAEGIDSLELTLRAVVSAPDGATDIRRSASASLTPDADPTAVATALGTTLAETLLDDGAPDIAPLRPDPGPPGLRRHRPHPDPRQRRAGADHAGGGA